MNVIRHFGTILSVIIVDGNVATDLHGNRKSADVILQ